MKRIKTNWLTILILCILGFSIYNNYNQHKEIKSLKSDVSEMESDKSDLFERVDSFQHELSVCKSEKAATNYYQSSIEEVETQEPIQTIDAETKARYDNFPNGNLSSEHQKSE